MPNDPGAAPFRNARKIRLCAAGHVVQVSGIRLSGLDPVLNVGARHLLPVVRVNCPAPRSHTPVEPRAVPTPAPSAVRMRLGEPPHSLYGQAFEVIGTPTSFFEDQDMPHVAKIAILAAFVVALAGISNSAAAREGLYPLTRCGPDLAYLCPIHGYFDTVPFHYNLAIHPDCIKVIAVQTPHGVERRRAIVCGAPQRPMIWW